MESPKEGLSAKSKDLLKGITFILYTQHRWKPSSVVCTREQHPSVCWLLKGLILVQFREVIWSCHQYGIFELESGFIIIIIFFFSFLFFFYFIFKLYNIVLVLPNIEMNLPQEKSFMAFNFYLSGFLMFYCDHKMIE